MSDSPFFSIVMPVYNVEKYLSIAVNSVLEQTFTDFELILVDDCSPDNSGKICDELAQSDKRIKVIHLPENKGLSNVRNTGVDFAQGNYISFIDSDDFVEPTLFSEIAKSLSANQAQVVMFGFTEDYYDSNNNLKQSYKIGYQQKQFDCAEDLRKEVIKIEESTLYGYTCNKFYNLKYLKDINLKFETIPLIEDIQFNVLFFMNIKSLNILNITPYHYNKRLNQSLTGRYVPDYYNLHAVRVSLLLNQYKYWNMCTNEVKQILANIYCRYIFSALQRNCDPRAHFDHKDRKKWIFQLFNADLYKELMPYACPNSIIAKILCCFLIHKRVGLCLCSGRFIFIVKNSLPMVFARAKQKR